MIAFIGYLIAILFYISFIFILKRFIKTNNRGLYLIVANGFFFIIVFYSSKFLG